MTRAITDIGELEQAILAREGIKLVSFDVFDTVVERAVPHPDLTKTPAARALNRILKRHSLTVPVADLVAQRLAIEMEQRLAAKQDGRDAECRIDEVFMAWLSRNGLEQSDQLVEELIEAELRFEREVVHPREGIVEMLQRLKSQGIRLVYATDSYLRQWMVDAILEGCGMAGLFDAGYVSCELGKAKYSGRMFQTILDENSLSPNELLHVGDRRDADLAGARKAAVSAIQFIDPATVRRHSVCAATNKVRKANPFWTGALWCNQGIAPPERAVRCDADLRYQLGYEYLGPLFCNFVHRLVHRLGDSNAELVIFNARDGFLLLELFERIAAALGMDQRLPAVYAYLTRKSVYAASLREFGRREIDMGFYTINPTLRNMFVRFSLPEDRLEEAARRAGFSNLDELLPDPHQSERLQRLFNEPEFLDVMADVQREASGKLADYLSALGYWGCKSVALVDVGWNGTAQEALDIAFEDRHDAPVIHGYYLALLGNRVARTSDRSRFTGLFHDYRETQVGTFFSRFVELFETACRAPHPTVIGFRRNDDGSVWTEFKDRESADRQAERDDDQLVASLQAGILDYCDDYVRTLEAHDTGPEALGDYILFKMDRLIRFPDRAEARLLSSFSHSEDFGQSLVYRGATSSQKRVASERKTRGARQRMLWREGAFRQWPIPLVNGLFNLYRVARARRY